MLGQPSSLLETTYPSTSKPFLKEAAQDMDLGAMVGHVYASVREDPVKLILEERLDEKGGMLMDGNLYPWCNLWGTNVTNAPSPLSPDYATTQRPPVESVVSPNDNACLPPFFYTFPICGWYS